MMYETYYRKYGTHQEQENLRERVHWICEQVDGQQVLDVGCNQGVTSLLLGKEGFHVVGIDENKQLIDFAQRQLNKESEYVKSRVQFIFNALQQQEFSQSFDTIILANILDEVTRPEQLLEKVKQWLNPDGKLLITVPFGYELDKNHKRSFYFSNLVDLFEESGIYLQESKVVGNAIAISASIKARDIDLDVYKLLYLTEEYLDQLIKETVNPKEKGQNYQNFLNKQSYEQVEVIQPEGNENTNKKYNELLDKYNTIRQERDNRQRQIEKLEKSIVDQKNTLRFRMGDEIASALLKPSFRTLFLPFTITKMMLEGAQNVNARNNRKKRKKGNQPQVRKNVSTNNNYGLAGRDRELNKIKSFKSHTLTKQNRPDVKVACILDNFSYECFKYECTLEQLRRETWEEQIEQLNPDFLLVESAWHGVDMTWKFMLTDIQNKEECAIRDLVNYCKTKNIPTVFWNKEDPPNYDHFIETARLFDVVFTTEENVIPKYNKDLSHNNIFALPFAAQPNVHNPVNINFKAKNNVAFAGSWYAQKHFERQQDMDLILSGAKNHGLHIFDRFFNFTENDRYKFPEKFQEHIIGSLDYEDMVKAYKMYKVFLNINSVKDSSTMFSRRVYELLASGTNVISTYSKGIQELFGDIVSLCETEEQVSNQVKLLINNPEISERLSLIGIREVYSKHLYKHRFQTILEKLNINIDEHEEGVSVVTCTNRENFLETVFENFISQTVEKKELVIVLNSDDMAIEKWEEKAQEYNDHKITVLQLPEDKTLGECLNYGIDNSTYEYIAKFDDDDYYAPNYLQDALHAFTYSGADLVGKKTFLTYVESYGAIAVRTINNENKITDFVHGGTLVFTRKLYEDVRFEARNRGEDTAFLRTAREKGYKVYSANRFNFVYMRSANLEHHTWKIDETEFMKNCKIIAYTTDYKPHATV
ncbi:glycosyltransferase family protein [Alkalihalobacterium alkalinitrilicum]|uniref:glycosyltransferase family protein n=1 Tax=Alkalihalobacterium alkalinitrilicum TaxID=427920 RepID=UPI000994C91A|nr:methyltransferase domain-containing protein [Alkalihalobacterium alkalinitrilicum]